MVKPRQNDDGASTTRDGNMGMLHMTAELIPQFSGQDVTSDVSRWIQDVEENAEIFCWTPLQTLLVARRALSGTAALWLRAEKPHRSWDELKAALSKEFADSVDAKSIHELMSARKKSTNESCLDYMLVMKELGRRGKMPDNVAIKYVIDGIRDLETNKIMLYGVTTYKELKEKLKIYETVKEKIRAESHGRTERRHMHGSSSQLIPPKKCFNCGEQKHLSADCPHKDKGAKCFRCNLFGHVAGQCQQYSGTASGSQQGRQATSSGSQPHSRASSGYRTRTAAAYCCDCDEEPEPCSEAVNTNMEDGARCVMQISDVWNVSHSARKPIKVVKVCEMDIEALVDTGSEVNLISEDCYKKLGSPKSEASHIVLRGLGSRQVGTMGMLSTKVQVDGQVFKDICFLIVPSHVMPFSMIIGQQLLQRVTVVMDNNEVYLLPSNEDSFRNVACVVSNLDVVGHEISKGTQQRVRDMVASYEPTGTKDAPIELKIHLKDDQPVSQRPRRIALKEQLEVDAQIEQWLADGIIRVSTSEYSSPIVLVRKRDNSLRVCVDYRKLNQKMVKDQYPLPIIDDHIDKCQKAKIFSVLDLKNGYFHLRVHEDSIKYTSFVTMTNQYEFLRAPFGIATCPKVFTRFITIIFRDLIANGSVIIFIDDILIPAETEEEAVERLAKVLKTASEYGLVINWKKCKLMVRKVEYLGYLIENGTIQPSPEKTKAVLHYPEPKDLKQLHSFVGLCSYFRKFIFNFALIAKPLTDLLKKDNKFCFNSEHRESFNALKEKLASSPVLKVFNPRLQTELHTDASCAAYSAIIMQFSEDDGALHPVHYLSRKTSDAESKYSSYELEALAVVEGIKKFRHYLFGIHFKVVTDCKAFEMTLKKRDLAMSTRVARWIILLQDYDFEVVHREGSRMRHVDALSRHPYVAAIFSDLHEGLRYAQQQDEGLRAITEVLQDRAYEDYTLDNGLLYKGLEKQLVVPKTLENDILKRAHENGHFAKRKMMSLVSKDFYIPQLEKKIDRYLLTCIPCLLANKKDGKQEGFLHTIDKESIPLHTLHIDHLGPMMETKKQYNYILTLVDAFTKFTWIFPTRGTTSRETIEKLKVHQQHFGNPSRIVSDRGTAFTSKDFEEYCQQEDIQHIKITTGIPRGNGQVERLHRVIISVLTKLCIETPALWYKHVSRVQRSLNGTYQRSISTSPYELLIGTRMKSKEDIEIGRLLTQENVDSYAATRDDLRAKAKSEILRVQEENTKNFNKKRKESRKYQVGDIVAIRRTQFGVGMKLKAKYLGPYQVKAAKGNDRYDVEKMDVQKEGPKKTSSAADFMKPWPADAGVESDEG